MSGSERRLIEPPAAADPGIEEVVRTSVALFDCLREFPDEYYCRDLRREWSLAVLACKAKQTAEAEGA